MTAEIERIAAEVEEDAYGRTGTRVECWVCVGFGVEYEETCVTCGGYGWINEPRAHLEQHHAKD